MTRERILFHIGLPKTGTTVIQQRILSALPGNLAKPRSEPEVGRMRRLAWEIGSGRLPARRREECADRWWAHFDSMARSVDPGPAGYVVSEERIGTLGIPGKRPRLRRRVPETPAASFLRVITESCPRDMDIRVLVVLRGQATLLASLYAQWSRNLPFASQEAFERHVRTILKRPGYGGRAALEWDRLLAQVADIVGRDRTTVLFFEEMATERYWQDLAMALGLDQIDVSHRRPPDPGQENRRSAGANRWELRPLRPPHLNAISIRKNGWPLHRRIGRRVLGEIDYRVRKHDRGCIQITDTLRAEITRAYRESNDQLSSMVGRDVTELGY